MDEKFYGEDDASEAAIMSYYDEMMNQPVCPNEACQSINTTFVSFPSFGGTTEGYTECDDCGKKFDSWCDLSAVM